MAISVQHLTKLYGTQRAVDDLSFTVEPGQVLGFLGPNGAGKTTTMKIATCYLPPTSGTITLQDATGLYNIHEHPLEIRRRIGYLPEHNPLYLDMYVHEFLAFSAAMYRIPAGERTQRVRGVIEQTGLGREQHKKIGALSKGYRQRVGLCQALIHEPEVLILDEPTTGLDPNQIVEIRSLIREVGRNKTVIFSSHILTEVEAIADRVVIINQGRIVADRPTGDVRTETQEETVVHIEVEKPGLDLSGLMYRAGVAAITAEGPTGFVIRTQTGVDVRRALFEVCMAQDNAILALRTETFSLEDAFRKLTGK